MRDRAKKRLSRNIMLILCFAGFLYQSIEISLKYFSYPIIVTSEIVYPGLTSNPGVTLCFRYGDIINYQLVNEKYPEMNLSYVDQHRNDYETLQELLTIRDIFEMTPSVEYILVKCQLRKTRSPFMETFNNTQGCNEVFTVDKYYSMDYLCYIFNYTTEYWGGYTTFDVIGYTPDEQGLILQLELNITLFQKADEIKPIVHMAEYLPINSIGVTPPTQRVYDHEKGRGKYDHFAIDYYSTGIFRLPPPYPTMCLDYMKWGRKKFTLQKDCIDDCVDRTTFKSWHRVMFMGIIREALDVHHVTKRFVNETLEKELSKIFVKCKNHCGRLPCIDAMSICSTSRLEIGYDEAESIEFRVNIPQRMSHRTYVYPGLGIMEYFIYVSSCVNLWFGLSSMDINPFPMIMKTGNAFFQTKGTSTLRKKSGNESQQQLRVKKRKHAMFRESSRCQSCLWSGGLCHRHRVKPCIKQASVCVGILRRKRPKPFIY